MKKFFLKLKNIKQYIKRFLGMIKLFLAWLVLNIFRRNLYKRKIWLVCEKRNEARDNGYHFYKYLKQNHPEIHSYYVITKDAADLPKVQVLGDVIYANSFKHCLYYLAASKSISSQAYGAYPFAFNLREIKLVNKLCNSKQKTIFLQHGIIKDELSHAAFDYANANIDYFVCSAQREYEFIKGLYGYPDGTIGCIGLCRFDNLHRVASSAEKMVLVMPTWRFWLRRKEDGVPLTESEISSFRASEFYQAFQALLTSEGLLDCLRKNGYKLCFYMHYQIQDYTELFEHMANDVIVIANRFEYDVQDLLMRSKIMVTDYSSVQFDFAYMNKPMIYFQFDEDRFSSSHYAKGYFEYDRDGFGPRLYQAEEVISSLTDLVENDGKQLPLYQERIDGFFNIRDENNCQRTYEAIINLK